MKVNIESDGTVNGTHVYNENGEEILLSSLDWHLDIDSPGSEATMSFSILPLTFKGTVDGRARISNTMREPLKELVVKILERNHAGKSHSRTYLAEAIIKALEKQLNIPEVYSNNKSVAVNNSKVNDVLDSLKSCARYSQGNPARIEITKVALETWIQELETSIKNESSDSNVGS